MPLCLGTDRPFDQEGERRNPWWGDPSYRIIPSTATSPDMRLYHLHIDPSYAEQDLNCLFPLQRLQELVEAGEIGRSAPRHYSIMGYIRSCYRGMYRLEAMKLREARSVHRAGESPSAAPPPLPKPHLDSLAVRCWGADNVFAYDSLPRSSRNPDAYH
jgi:hypothetical protein